MLLNAKVAINTLLFLRKISTIIIFLPFTWVIIHSFNMFILLLTLVIGIISYIADLSYMKAFKHSNVTLAMSLNITYII